MSKYQKTQKQTEELNSSQIKEILLRFAQAMRCVETEYAEGKTSDFETHVALASVFNETSREITDTCSLLGYTEPIEDLLSVDNFFVQSGEASTEGVETQINLTFDDDAESDVINMPVTRTLYKPTGSVNSELNKFLSRPVLIHTINWEVGNSIDEDIRPWKLFFNHTSIRKKIDNYAFIRCDLHLKIMINASPFYYSALLCAYKPMVNFVSAPIWPGDGDVLVGYSQRPNVVVYPQNSEGGEMVIPFVYPREWLRLTSDADLSNMGALFINTFADLMNANSVAGTSVDVQFYAWAENIEMAGLTVDLAVQSKDEYGKGPVSKPASAIARATGMLSKVPIIGNYMTATSVAADAVSNIAAMFGYTKVPVIEDVKPFKNLPFHGLATAEISDCTERLCIDSKNELTIDNSAIGAEQEDPLLISNFVQHKSYLTSFTWQSSDAADTLLWNSYVTPFMSVVTAGTGQTIVNGTPMWVVSNMFDYWRGDIIFDLKILCSQYHRGRLRVSWDPVGNIANTVNSSTEVYTTIVDITEDTNVSLRVPYCQRTAYQHIPSNPTSTIFATTPLAKDTSDTVNGILTVRVLNEQTSPVASADILVLVSVRGAENLEFASPKEIHDDLSHYTVQSGLQVAKEVTFGGSSQVDDNINLVYMGERVVNLRSLLMRCNQSLVELETASSTKFEYQLATMNRRPLFRGYDVNGIHSANEIVGASTHNYNFVNTSPYHLLSPCFLGERGSFTWKVDYDGPEPSSIMISRPKTNLNRVLYNYLSTDVTGMDFSAGAAFYSGADMTNSGALLLNQRTNTGVSVNAPQYSIVSFLETAPNFRTLGLANVSGNDSLRYTFLSKRLDNATDGITIVKHLFQAGPDYSPVFFLNVPTMYIYASTPTAA